MELPTNHLNSFNCLFPPLSRFGMRPPLHRLERRNLDTRTHDSRFNFLSHLAVGMNIETGTYAFERN
jgi:hypothetical protein